MSFTRAFGPDKDAVHSSHWCNHCNVAPIKGPRFHCVSCLDYDLCRNCEANQSETPHGRVFPSHMFLKITCSSKPETRFPLADSWSRTFTLPDCNTPPETKKYSPPPPSPPQGWLFAHEDDPGKETREAYTGKAFTFGGVNRHAPGGFGSQTSAFGNPFSKNFDDTDTPPCAGA